MVTSYGVGQYSAAHDSTGAHVYGSSRLYVGSGTKRLVVWCHSAGGSGTEPWIATNNTLPILDPILNLGLPVISADFSGVAWGNDASQTALTDALSFAAGASVLNAATSKVILCGVSMGGMLALNWARANASKVSAILLFYPAVNLQAIHDGTGGATAAAASTEAAYGGSLGAFNAAVVAHDPAQNASSYAGVPIRMYYSTADTTVGSANQTAFAAAVGGSAFSTVSLGAAGHADMTKISVSDVVGQVANYS